MKAELKRETVKKYATCDEDIIMLAKVLDKAAACRDKNYLQATRFLSLHETIVAETALKGEKIDFFELWGGYDGAERRIILFYPEYMDSEAAKSEAGISVLRAHFRPRSVTHRDILGALMNIGITRECLGDLLIHEDFCDIICVSESAEFISDNLLRAGRETLKIEQLNEPPAEKEENYKLIKDTVASMRLDSVVASGCSVSRANAAAIINSGRVKVNDFECQKTDRIISNGDLISVRGYGRMIISASGDLSRKGRTIIEIKKFL